MLDVIARPLASLAIMGITKSNSLPILLFVSFILAWSCCDANPSSCDYLSGVPKSAECRYARYFDRNGEHHNLPHWNPSSQIDKDGFLLNSYCRVASEYEDNVEGIHHKSRLASNPVRVRQVPGDGNCLFHSLVICLNWVEKNSHYCYKDYHELRRISRHLRREAIKYLAKRPKRKFYLHGDNYVSGKDLLANAAESCNTTPKEYCKQMWQESYWGGNHEVIALSNLLRRPIHIYELHPRGRKEFQFRRVAHYGSPRFDKKEALHILSADSRFPDVRPGKQTAVGQHYLGLFPEAMTSKQKRMRVRGGKKHYCAKSRISGGFNFFQTEGIPSQPALDDNGSL